MRVRLTSSLVLALLTALLLPSCGSSGELTVSDVWSRPVPPVSPASAVFLEISNGLDTTVTLTGASSDSCDSMELHQTTMDDAGVMTMRPLEAGLRLEPDTTGLLAPGAIHLMCMQPKVFEGTFDLELILDGADPITVAATIEDR